MIVVQDLKLIYMIYDKNTQKWFKLMKLGRLLGCHQKPERSFFYKEYQFPLCARCTGVIIATFFAVVLFFKRRIKFKTSVLLSFIMFFDWFLQFVKIKQSNNNRRLITGLIGGYGVATIHMYFYKFLFDKLKKQC